MNPPPSINDIFYENISLSTKGTSLDAPLFVPNRPVQISDFPFIQERRVLFSCLSHGTILGL